MMIWTPTKVYRRNWIKVLPGQMFFGASAHFLCITKLPVNRITMGVMRMKCAWKEYLAILPPRLRADVDILGRDKLKETRLRLGFPPELILHSRSIRLRTVTDAEDIRFVIQTASKYSAWAASTAACGFITAPGGHRIGICGEAVCQEGKMRGIRRPTSLCIRAARQFPELAEGSEKYKGSILIIGPPGSGKTTLLREWIRRRSELGPGSISVVDERGELFPMVEGVSCFDAGFRTDIITGCSKAEGLSCVLRTMTPSCIALDEITSEEDCQALVHSMWSGVDLMATAHAFHAEDLHRRELYRTLTQAQMFQTLVVMDREQNWHTERMRQWISVG